MLEEAEHVSVGMLYEKSSFRNKLDEMHIFLIHHSPVDAVLDNLNDSFTYGELRRCVDDL
jgi:hypothetical protein